MIRAQIKGYEGLYEISDEGEVFSLQQTSSRRKGRLSPYINDAGYLRVNLYDSAGKVRKFYVHRLVAIHFVPGYKFGFVVNHIDCNKQNNRAQNLEWCNQKDNIKHSIDHGLQHRLIVTEIDGIHFKSMKLASENIGLKGYVIGSERRKQGNKFSLLGHAIKCGDAVD
ncbi:MAG: NUMOD4 motif-containing HNH endonuclease [Lentilactobacillus diolivorans]|jgi:hypothetical protein|nr:NUMOD4 motif-containing HNH endonuclease [Lentilactobacillus diolivorans]